MPKQQTQGKKSCDKIGRGLNKNAHKNYNAKHHYTALSNPKAGRRAHTGHYVAKGPLARHNDWRNQVGFFAPRLGSMLDEKIENYVAHPRLLKKMAEMHHTFKRGV